MTPNRVQLDPHDLDHSIRQLASAYDFDTDALAMLSRVIALYPRAVTIYVDEAQAPLYGNIPLTDKFTFDMETDELILFARDLDTFVDGLIEMAMYMTGFSTMMGTPDAWVTEFTIGAWKPVKNRIKRQLGIPVQDRQSKVVGLPPPPEKAADTDPYPFRTLVSRYDLASFYQMVLLATRDDITVYFPPETHPKVLAVYVYTRRSMQEAAQGIHLGDHEQFNTNLLQEIQRLEKLFHPGKLRPPDWLHTAASDETNRLGLVPGTDSTPPESPFDAFIEELFEDDDTENNR